MQIVIDISESFYKLVISNDWGEKSLGHIIKTGIVLPENHGRLIDADALALEMRDIAPEPYFSPMWAVTQTDIEEAPTIIEADKESKDENSD